MKVAIVCDWLTNVGGAEKVLLAVHKMYPKAPIYTSKYSPKGIDWFNDADVRTGWLQIFPARLRRLIGPLRQMWFERLDLSAYDLVVSVTGAEAKAVKCENKKTGQRSVHVSYCHVPTQYYWQMYDDYVRDPGFGVLNPVVRAAFKLLVRGQRKKDFAAAGRVDQFVTISAYAKEMIKKYYKRDAVVVWPPVETEIFRKVSKTDSAELHSSYYVVSSRQVTWKRLDLAVSACKELGRELLVVGEGPEHERLVALAAGAKYIKFLPLQTREELAKILAGAQGYIFPSLEPFGIAPVEALASGCPVIAFGEGGAMDYVKDGVNGVVFPKQTVASVKSAILRFEKMKFDESKVVKSAEKFGAKRFEDDLRRVIDEMVA